MTEEQRLRVYGLLTEAANICFGEDGEARSGHDWNFGEDIGRIQELMVLHFPALATGTQNSRPT